MAESKNNNTADRLDGLIKERIFIITLNTLTFAIVCDWYSLKVKAAAPVAKWAIGKSSIDVLRYYMQRDATINVLILAYPMQ